MAFDRRAGKLIALAANTDGAQESWTVETWTFDVCTNTWTRMHPDREPPALVSGLVYDVDSHLTVGVHYEDWRDQYVIGNVWAYDLEANTWTEQGVAPTDALRFYDPVSGLVVAGSDEELWSYDVETDTWALIQQANGPPWGWGVFAYDASVDRLVEYTGGDLGNEIWRLDIRTGTWSRSGAEAPSFRMGWGALPFVAYDEAMKRTVVAGGNRWGAYDATADRWEILAEADPGKILAGADPGGLSALYPMAYDPLNRRFVGPDQDLPGALVAFDLVTREWTLLDRDPTVPWPPPTPAPTVQPTPSFTDQACKGTQLGCVP